MTPRVKQYWPTHIKSEAVSRSISDGLSFGDLVEASIVGAEVEPDLIDWDCDTKGYADTAALMADAGTAAESLAKTKTFVSSEDQITADLASPPGAAAIVLNTSGIFSAYGIQNSMEYQYTHGGPSGCTTEEIQRYIRFASSSGLQEIWVEFLVRWSTNFRGFYTGSPCSQADHKFVFIDTVDDNSGRVGLHIGTDTTFPGVAMASTFAFPTPAWNTNERVTGYNADTQLRNGGVHIVRIRVKCSTTASSNDGACQLWLDGVLKWEASGFNCTKQNGTTVERVWGINIGANKDDGPPGEIMTLNWGRIRGWSTNPGW